MSLGLVLDLSHTGFAAVLSADGGQVLASQIRQGGTRHDDLGDWLESLLTEAGSRSGWKDVQWIGVGLGPGSFTGIRIAMAFVQGVALPGKIPLHGFTSFEALFLSGKVPEPGEGPRIAAIAANAGRFYVARGLEDPGILTDGPAPAGALTPGDASWDYKRIARHALTSKRDAHKPYYLQASAAEDKAARNT